MLFVCPKDTPVPNNKFPNRTGTFSCRLTCSRAYPGVLTLAMLLLVISTAPRSASIAPSEIPRVPNRLPMKSALLHRRWRRPDVFGGTQVGHCIIANIIHKYAYRPSGAAQVRGMNLAQP